MSRKVALVTGVSRIKGIGRSICLELARRDFDIFFTYWTAYDDQMPWGVDANEPTIIEKEITALGVHCAKLELDLSKEDSVDTLLQHVSTTFGELHVLVNNATYSTETNLETLSSAELDRHYQVNVRATTLLTLAFARQFKQNNHGRVINLSSGQSLGAMSGEIAYAITKGAIETLTTTLVHELAAKGITINAVNPGPNDTGWMSDEFKDELKNQFPMKRVGTPKDTAKLVGFLASEDAEWITGQIIHSEGGFKR